MPKVTVYVSDDQLDQLKAVRGFGRGGVSKLFQAFLESATSGQTPAGRYDYARKLMPLHAAVERHRRGLARKVQAGGPPADGGPVAAALAILLYKRLVDEDPTRAQAFEKEFARFGLDELVAAETEGVDLLAEPEEDEEVADEDAIELPDFFAPLAGLRLGESVQDALRGVHAWKVRDARRDEREAVGEARETVREARRAGRAARGRVRVVISSDDDPRDVLTATDFETFTSRHGDWEAGAPLTPSQMETVRELLIVRAGGDPAAEDAEAAEDAGAGTEGESEGKEGDE
jgi:hypothetical protein